MAYVIHQQPVNIAYTRTPVLYLVGEDTLITETAFQYIAEVYLWQGLYIDKPLEPEYELKKPPANISGQAVFEISNLAADWIITPEFNIDEDPGKTKEMYVFAEIQFGYEYIDSSGNLIVAKNLIQSNTLNIYNGYNYYSDGINYVPNINLGLNYPTEPAELPAPTGDGYFMTDAPKEIDIPLNTSMYRFILNDSKSAVKTVVIDVNNGEHVSILSLITYDSELVAIPCGTKEIVNYFAIDQDTLETYMIYGGDENGDQITYAHIFNIKQPCKYGFINLQFLNRFGVWDNIFMYGAKHETLNVDRMEIQHSPMSIVENEFNFIKQYGQFHMANIHGDKTLNVNTGWISEDWNEIIKQLFLTQYLYDADILVPYTLQDKSIKFKTSLNDGLSNYSMTLKMAHTTINTVR